MYLLKLITASLATGVLVLGFAATAMATPPIPMTDGMDEALILWVQAGGRQNDHPAWSFGCAEPDISIRAVPCDDPVYVYGNPCEVGTGRIDRPRPCNTKQVETEPAAHKVPDSDRTSGPWFNPFAFFSK